MYEAYKQEFIKKYMECQNLADELNHHLEVGNGIKVYIDSEALLYIATGREVPNDIIYISTSNDHETVTIARSDSVEVKSSRNERVAIDQLLADAMEQMDKFIKDKGCVN